jgi:hypothetical protein
LIVPGEEPLMTTAARRGEPALCALEAQPALQKAATTIMKELTSAGWIKVKGLLFLVIGFVAALLIILEHTEVKTAILLAISIWCFCRFYYFAFYVIQHYVDDRYQFSGLCSFAMYLWRSKNDLNAKTQKNDQAKDTQNH